ncbi:MAG: hypothetical protein OQJ81_09505 [Melioribacteraceae bacterium]|jgi:hypothetical protein|nr:hypothetical protein [Melioribacteraceae bacterium]
MKKVLLPLLLIFFTLQLNAQIEDRINELSDDLQKGYSTPLATWTGTYLNSGGYYSASVSKVFGFKLSLVGMMILIPDDQRTFTLDGGTKTATFFGEKGAAVAGTDGYLVYPPGINQTSIPTGIPQVAVSTLGSEVMLRFIPSVAVEDVNFDLLGIGLKHSISQYIPLLPVDIAVQVMYNKLSIDGPDLGISTTNMAFNAHASRSFGLITLYGGLQYESTTMDIEYSYKGSDIVGTSQDEKIKVSLDGDNNVRLTLGAALRLAVLVINADVNFGSQTAIVAGLNFEF